MQQRNELSEAGFAPETPALFCSLLTGRRTDPALPPQTPLSPSFFLHLLLLLVLGESERFRHGGGGGEFAFRPLLQHWEGGRIIQRPTQGGRIT